jgi:hypothetical protein
VKPRERLAGCLCGGCEDCLEAQGYPTETCPDCEDGWLHDPEEQRPSRKCKRCSGRGRIVQAE